MAQLFTTGYEQYSKPGDLISVLRQAGVECLVDVRELPLSRRRGFSKKALAAALTDAGVHYDHARALGNPKPFRDLYRSGQQDRGEKAYLAHLRNGSAHAVDDLAKVLIGKPTCLLCYEADPQACHRSLVVDELRLRIPRLQVEHL